MPGIKTVMFMKRIVVFHETFAMIGTGKKKRAVRPRNIFRLWHEAIAGRKAEEIEAAFVKAMLHAKFNTLNRKFKLEMLRRLLHPAA